MINLKKRLLCLLLCALTLVSVLPLAGCALRDDEEEEEDELVLDSADSRAMTLTIYSITNESTTPDAIAAVEEELNLITEAQLNVHVDLRLYPEDEYQSVIDARIAEIEEQNAREERIEAAEKKASREGKAAGVTTAAETDDLIETTYAPDETEKDEYGLEHTVYPDAEENQMDVFLITDIDTYTAYKSKNLLVPMDDQLSINSKIITKYMHPYFIDALSHSGGVFGIPCNHAVGTYTYLLLNKELTDKYYYNPNGVETVYELKDYFDAVANLETGYVPLLNRPDPYINKISEDSIFGAAVTKTGIEQQPVNEDGEPIEGIFPTSYTPSVIYGIRIYQQVADMLATLELAGNLKYGDPAEIKCGAAIVKGDCTVPEVYGDDYYVTVDRYPTFTNEEVFGSMYAVSSYCASPSRAIQMIELMMCNEKFRNIFQYGVENVNYERDELSGIVTMLNDSYSMNSRYTGNQFLLWQNSDMSEDELRLSDNNWAYGKQQNVDAVKSVFLGFAVQRESDPEDIGKIYYSTNEAGEEFEDVFLSVDQFMNGYTTDKGKEKPGVKQISAEYLLKDTLEEYLAYKEKKNLPNINYTGYLQRVATELSSYEAIYTARENEIYTYSIVNQYGGYFDREWYAADVKDLDAMELGITAKEYEALEKQKAAEEAAAAEGEDEGEALTEEIDLEGVLARIAEEDAARILSEAEEAEGEEAEGEEGEGSEAEGEEAAAETTAE